MSMVDKFTYSIKEDDGLRYVEGEFADGNDFDLGLTEIHCKTSATASQVYTAFCMANDLWMDPLLGSKGRRNKDAVNLCIALHVLGIDDVCEWANVARDMRVHRHAYTTSIDSWSEFEEHVQRVSEYLCAWGPDNDMGRALDKVIQ